MTWSVDELIRRAAQALADGDVRSANGRVTPLPDQRLIRWYATIGLVDRPLSSQERSDRPLSSQGPSDRPLSSQGRSAQYGPRHLLQLVAIKRRQAEGRTLADIQVELAGAPDATLAGIARVPEHLLADQPAQPQPAAGRFWATPPTRQSTMDPVGPGDKPLSGVRLGDVVLLIPATPDAGDLAAIRAATQPLLDVLVHRGLLPPPGGSTA